jgi:N-hydroxyarylamine O-acetyltransferase
MASGELDLDPYLARTGYRGPRESTLPVLTGLHAAHLAAIPFENLDILLGRKVALDLPALQAKLVAGRRGGYCFEHNTLFQAVLSAFGFRVTPLAARVLGGGIVRPRTHMLLRVDLAEGPYLADVGFGGDGFVHPIPLAAGVETRVGSMAHRLRPDGEAWVLEGRADGGEWGDLYVFTLEPQLPVDYEMANHYTSTHPASRFVQTLTAQRTTAARRSVLRNRDLAVSEDGATTTSTVRDPEELVAVLDREFGLRFPPGTRFTRPGF